MSKLENEPNRIGTMFDSDGNLSAKGIEVLLPLRHDIAIGRVSEITLEQKRLDFVKGLVTEGIVTDDGRSDRQVPQRYEQSGFKTKEDKRREFGKFLGENGSVNGDDTPKYEYEFLPQTEGFELTIWERPILPGSNQNPNNQK